MNIEHGEKQSSVRNKEMASKSPDFEALRAERNRIVMDSHKRLADEFGINLADIRRLQPGGRLRRIRCTDGLCVKR